MSISNLITQFPCILSALIFTVFVSGCSSNSDNYSQQLDARPMPSSSENIVSECAWITQESESISENIVRVNATKTFYAWEGPITTKENEKRLALLNERSNSVGCS